MKKAVGTDFIPEQAQHLYLVKMEYEMQSSSAKIDESWKTLRLFTWMDQTGVICAALALLLLVITCIAQLFLRFGWL